MLNERRRSVGCQYHGTNRGVRGEFTKGPVFVVGMNGSGTTLLLNCLDRHPNLYGFARETKVLPYFLSRQEKYGPLQNDVNFRRLWDDVRNANAFKKENNGTAPPLPENWRELPHDLSTIVDTILSYFASREDKARWCEKTPRYTLHMLDIARLFPRARFIHIIRDGRDAAASFHRRWGNTPQRSIFIWKNLIREARRQGSVLCDKYMEVFYQELTESPEEVLRRVCNFINEPFSANMLNLRTHRGPQTDSASFGGKVYKNPSKYAAYFSKAKIRSLETIAGAELSHLGYKTEYPCSDRDPNKFQLMFWMATDYIRYEFHKVQFYRRKGIIHEYLRRRVQGSLRDSLRQFLSSKF